MACQDKVMPAMTSQCGGECLILFLDVQAHFLMKYPFFQWLTITENNSIACHTHIQFVSSDKINQFTVTIISSLIVISMANRIQVILTNLRDSQATPMRWDMLGPSVATLNHEMGKIFDLCLPSAIHCQSTERTFFVGNKRDAIFLC